MGLTTDGGATWVTQNPPSTTGFAAYNSVVCIDALFYGFGTGQGAARVVVTTNGGISWLVQPLGITGTFVSAFTMKDDKLNGVASINLPTIARTTNGGTSWTSQNTGPSPTGFARAKWVHGSNIVYVSGATGSAGAIRRSSDGGVTWTQMTTSSLDGVRHFEYFRDTDNRIYLYSISDDGSILKYVDESLVGIDPNNKNVPIEYRLEQNYPNPFNPATTIKYALPKASNVTLKIYDMLGNEVMSVVNGYQIVGNYVETIDASSLASGVYFYKLTAGDFTDSKKMTVVK
jgi:photosystem II stability/assembly factor-like uncharacterized protein